MTTGRRDTPLSAWQPRDRRDRVRSLAGEGTGGRCRPCRAELDRALGVLADLSAVLAATRRQRELTLAQAAAQVQASMDQYRRWERGDVRPATVSVALLLHWLGGFADTVGMLADLPSVLEETRLERGLSYGACARQLDTQPILLARWITNGEQPRFPYLVTILQWLADDPPVSPPTQPRGRAAPDLDRPRSADGLRTGHDHEMGHELAGVQPPTPEPWWQVGLRAAQAHHAATGNLNVVKTYVTPEGFPLGGWLNDRRVQRRRGKIPPRLEAALDAMGFVWDPDVARWEAGYAAAHAYWQAGGNLNTLLGSYVTPQGYPLGSWLQQQKDLCARATFHADRVGRLEALGFAFGRPPRPRHDPQQRAAPAPEAAAPTGAAQPTRPPRSHAPQTTPSRPAYARDTFGHQQEQRLLAVLRAEGHRIWQATPLEDYHQQVDFWVATNDRQIPIQATVATDPGILARKHRQLAGRGIALLAVRYQLLTQAQAADPLVRQTATGDLLKLLDEAIGAIGANEHPPQQWTDWFLTIVPQLHHAYQAADTPIAEALTGRRRRLALLAINELGVGYKRLTDLLGLAADTSVKTLIAKERTDLRVQDEWLQRAAPTATPDQRVILREWVMAARLGDRLAAGLLGRPYPTWWKLPQLRSVVAWQQAILAAAEHFAVTEAELLQAIGSHVHSHELRQIRDTPAAPDPSLEMVELLSRAASILAELLPVSDSQQPDNLIHRTAAPHQPPPYSTSQA